jgi:hypothetical protein
MWRQEKWRQERWRQERLRQEIRPQRPWRRRRRGLRPRAQADLVPRARRRQRVQSRRAPPAHLRRPAAKARHRQTRAGARRARRGADLSTLPPDAAPRPRLDPRGAGRPSRAPGPTPDSRRRARPRADRGPVGLAAQLRRARGDPRTRPRWRARGACDHAALPAISRPGALCAGQQRERARATSRRSSEPGKDLRLLVQQAPYQLIKRGGSKADQWLTSSSWSA